MAIETRGSGRYYYRKRRVGGHVVSEYCGAGYGADIMAQLDEHERAQAEQKRQAWQEVKRSEDAIDREIDAIGEQLKQLVEATLLVSGFHTHKRTWRKRRGPSR